MAGEILATNANYQTAIAQQACAADTQSECGFADMLKDAMGTAVDKALAKWTGQQTAAADGAEDLPATARAGQVETKLNEAIAVAFIAPLLTQAVDKAEQTYFANSPAERAYAKQMYTEIAGKIGSSGKLPLARSIAKALLQRMKDGQVAA